MMIQSVAVIGLGYVGLPLAVHLARARYDVTGVDINPLLIRALLAGEHANLDLPKEVFPIPKNMRVAMSPPAGMDAYIVCVPTPHLDGQNRMDASYVIATCRSIGKVISTEATVVIESTVTPGSTNGILRDTVAHAKGDYDFHMAFSPERVNPGASYFYEMGNTDKLIGTVSENNEALTAMYGRIFNSVVTVGIEEAEIAKTFENAQRDLNISLMNELAVQCYRKGLNYREVIKGLRTKGTSPVFTSGMVGGHCIPVDPYFLAEYYKDNGCLTLHGREVNESYIRFIADVTIDCNKHAGPVLIIGRSYKPGVMDIRNSGALKLQDYLVERGVEVCVHEPLTDDPYEGPTPAVLVGAINHHPSLHVFDNYGCDEKSVFINIGGGFTEEQAAPFHKIVEL